MSDDLANYESAQKLAGRTVLVGIICLIISLCFALASVAAMAGGPGGGRTFLTIAKVFGFIWLPLVGLGILMRVANTKPDSSKTDGEQPGDGV